MIARITNLHLTQKELLPPQQLISKNLFYIPSCEVHSTFKINTRSMACFERASPALKEILLRLYRDERAIDADHHLHEFGSVEYYIQSLMSDPDHTYLSISTPILSQAFLISTRLSRYTIEKVKAISSEVLEIVEPPKEGYQLTLRLNFARMPHESTKLITDIAAVQGVILSSQLEEMLMNVNSQDVAQGMYKPIKLVYHPREPFYVIKQPQKITAVFPMRFKEKTDVIIATAFFQELMDVTNTKACAKAPHCIWSPIPPPELRGEAIEDLSTNGGFVSFDITSRHIEGKRLDKTVWNLLNFYAFVKNHVKSTRGFIQRRMRTCLKSLAEVLQKTGLQDEQQIKEVKGYKRMKKLVNFTKFKIPRYRSDFISKLKRLRSRLKIHGFSRFRRKWLTFPTFSSKTKYRKLEKDISLQHN
ncbi:actin-related protein 2/3 complex subunit 2B isoform X2 [Solanum dulcamara]|uniref:actin-related protein 2/3 complex subunit 2B isoform X2 n=1 Tax=Solanum dulcamara TaxID=45834 RepID=UPI002485B2C6|nr:actin-related protein 2/3 complex subunit 2B isoform X2 [Solanum dulcamara]